MGGTNEAVEDPAKALQLLKEYESKDGISVRDLLDEAKTGGLTYNDFLLLPGYIGFPAATVDLTSKLTKTMAPIGRSPWDPRQWLIQCPHCERTCAWRREGSCSNGRCGRDIRNHWNIAWRSSTGHVMTLGRKLGEDGRRSKQETHHRQSQDLAVRPCFSWPGMAAPVVIIHYLRVCHGQAKRKTYCTQSKSGSDYLLLRTVG